MSRKIIIAGAGHGGLIAGALLAEKGYDVTVYERNIRDDLGYDWEDSVEKKIFRECSLPEPDESACRPGQSMKFYNPNLRSSITVSPSGEGTVMIERKYLYKMLLENAEEKGVRFVFNAEILSPIMDGLRVVGIRTTDGDVFGDIVIDAAGINSPVRRNLPVCCNIDRDYDYGECFYAYRAYFDKLPAPEPEIPYEVFLKPGGERGLSWVITWDNEVDVLIGKMQPPSKRELEVELEKMREFSPQIGRKVLRGGQIGQIPVRRPLSVMVCDGYAAVGDSAYMTLPMTGSGICASMRAGMILADVVSNDKNCEFSAKTLWEYNKRYILHFGLNFAAIDILKNIIICMETEGINFLFDKQIITESDMKFGKGQGGNMSFSDMASKAFKGIGNLPVLFRTAGALSKGDAAKKVYREIPQEYDEAAVLKWKADVLAASALMVR